MSSFRRRLMMASGKKDFTDYDLILPNISTAESGSAMSLNVYVNGSLAGYISLKQGLTINVKKGDVVTFANYVRVVRGDQYIIINGNRVDVNFSVMYDVAYTLEIDDIYTVDEIYMERFGVYFP